MKVKTFCRRMNVWPGYLYSLEAKGILPDRPRGHVTRDYAAGLVNHRRGLGLPLPLDAEQVVMECE